MRIVQTVKELVSKHVLFLVETKKVLQFQFCLHIRAARNQHVQKLAIDFELKIKRFEKLIGQEPKFTHSFGKTFVRVADRP